MEYIAKFLGVVLMIEERLCVEVGRDLMLEWDNSW